jgi:chromosome segregation ATPase
MEAKDKIIEMDEKNKELSMKVDELEKEKKRLEQEIAFKRRTIDIMSRDLVKERETRKDMFKELDKLRSDNVELKRELLMVNKEKARLQNELKEILEKKENLEAKISGIENVLKEKSLAFEELQEQLVQAVKEGKKAVPKEPASVQLPPIVVKPQVQAKEVKGEIIAVNKEENFVIIDKGEVDGIRPGAQLKVKRQDKIIGTIEVIETRREISAADIKEVVSGFAIQEGDIVIGKQN